MMDELVEQFGQYDPKLDLSNYHYPTLELLAVPASQLGLTAEILEANKHKIVETLAYNDIEVEQIRATIGPTLTLYEFTPAAGSRVAKIKALQGDLGLYLAAQVKVVGPIPGKGTMGVEIPHEKADVVAMRSVLATEKFQAAKMELPVVIGKTMDNAVYLTDLTALPHLLIAGSTGQGKSVFLNALISSLLYKKHPSELKLVLIDINRLEFNSFRKIARHFLAALPEQADPVIANVTQAMDTLNGLCLETDQRYELLRAAGARNIKEYNQKFIHRQLDYNDGHRFLPYIVTVIDEFAELMAAEAPINRLAQLGRPAGIHLVIATQRPSVKVITGSIKANFSSRLAFRVASNIDSRTILDASGAELLNGQGDMLFGTGTEIMHLQGAFIETAEVERICEFIGAQRGYPSPLYLPEYNSGPDSRPLAFDPADRDPLFEDCARLIVLHQQGSTSLIQRKLKLGYNRAGRIIDQLEAAGVVGPLEGSKAREVLFADEYSLERFLDDLAPEVEPILPAPVSELPVTIFPPIIIPEPESRPKGFWSKLFNRY
ncbi:DNA segregation ATPase FtsK/SpoIIIE-like protein [Mucilaginibacter sp. UYP25]